MNIVRAIASVWRVKSLGLRIQIWYGTLLLIVFTALYFFLAQDLYDDKVVQLNKQMRTYARNFSSVWQDTKNLSMAQGVNPLSQEIEEQIEKLHLQQQELIDRYTRDGFYLLAYTPALEIIHRTDNVPQNVPMNPPKSNRFRTLHRKREQFWEIERREPPKGILVLVGTNYSTLTKMSIQAWILLAAAFLGLYILTLFGGALIVSRSLRSLHEIHQGVSAVAKGQLTHRISADAPSELAPLVSELNSAFEELQLIFETQRRQSANASHELRTPVAALLAETQTMLARAKTLEHCDTCEIYNQSMTTCQDLALHMKHLISQLKVLAQAEKMDLNEAEHLEIDLSKMLKNLQKIISPTAQQKNIKLAIQIPSKAVKTIGDSQLLSQALSSILFNAVEYTHRGGKVTLSLFTADNAIHIDISDNGVGIGASDLPHVFERHYRGSNVTTVSANDKKYSKGLAEHSGLGLAIAKELIEAANGKIAVQSKVGKGTCFSVELPLHECPAEKKLA